MRMMRLQVQGMRQDGFNVDSEGDFDPESDEDNPRDMNMRDQTVEELIMGGGESFEWTWGYRLDQINSFAYLALFYKLAMRSVLAFRYTIDII